MTCPCGSRVGIEDRFCSECGASQWVKAASEARWPLWWRGVCRWWRCVVAWQHVRVAEEGEWWH